MPRKKKQDVAITAAIISGIFIVAAAYYQGPLADTHWKERPIVDVTLGTSDNKYPKLELSNDTGYYYVDIISHNRGQSDGKIIITINGYNAKVNFDKSNNFEYQKSLPYTIRPLQNYTTLNPPIYILPDENKDQFTIEMSVVEQTPKPPNQEINKYKPSKLSYKKNGEIFELVEKI